MSLSSYDPAFPHTLRSRTENASTGEVTLFGVDEHSEGLSKLEYFAAHAPAVPAWYDSNQDDARRHIAWPVHYARCVLAELERDE